jgi:hypothetical protein
MVAVGSAAVVNCLLIERFSSLRGHLVSLSADLFVFDILSK